jgi:hypothetical protein
MSKNPEAHSLLFILAACPVLSSELFTMTQFPGLFLCSAGHMPSGYQAECVSLGQLFRCGLCWQPCPYRASYRAMPAALWSSPALPIARLAEDQASEPFAADVPLLALTTCGLVVSPLRPRLIPDGVAGSHLFPTALRQSPTPHGGAIDAKPLLQASDDSERMALTNSS